MHGLYGFPPAELAAIAADAVQYSPFAPNSPELEGVARGSLQSLTVQAPPGTVERRHVLACALQALAIGAPLTVLAPKDKGGLRIQKELQAFGCNVEEEARRHHRICFAKRPVALSGIEEAIEAGAPRRLETGMWSQPGIFSWDEMDSGTNFLLQHLPPMAGKGADFGCGIGTLACAVLLQKAVTRLTLIDIDGRAVSMARRNVDPSRTDVLWRDIRKAGSGLDNLDFIVMNPPFHDGGNEDRSLGQSFVRRAHESLRGGGVLWMVANRHLPYEESLGGLFSQVRTVAQNKGYKIHEATK